MQVENGPLTVTWPVDHKTYSDVSNEQVMGKHPIASSLNHSVRVLLAGTFAYRPRNKMKRSVHRKKYVFKQSRKRLSVCMYGHIMLI